jgi:hypothetical protein
MNFIDILPPLIKEFERKKIRYALMGGMALAAWELVRGTSDIDFLMDRKDLSKASEILSTSFGFRLHHHSENISQFVSDIAEMGAVDILHAFRPHTLAMLDRAKNLPVFSKWKMPVLEAEDLIGLKVQAFTNDTARHNKDMADIQALLERHGSRLDWKRLEEYFELFNASKIFKSFKKNHAPQ